MTDIAWFTDEAATDLSKVGGKGVNLGRLTRRGFSVPNGFVVTATAHSAWAAGSGLDRTITELLAPVDYSDPNQLETVTAHIRDRIRQTPMSDELTKAISDAYRKLGSDVNVAVRSSGTAEDLEDASFAGLHDTYLDVRGQEDVLVAVRDCWASLWTARATYYRHCKSFEHDQFPIAVVVQTMIDSEVSGVMFTGNPMTAATDEIVINASYGLGEAIVDGSITPDEFTVRTQNLRILERKLGEKTTKVTRDRARGHGVKTEPVGDDEQGRFCLSDEQVQGLADLGLCIQDYYGGFPQDTEWAFADDQFYVLQARPITGVEFAWDAEVNESIVGTGEAGDELWSRLWPDSAWTGAVTPLFFTIRGDQLTMSLDHVLDVWGLPDLASRHVRGWKYHKGGVYFNAGLDRIVIEKTVPPPFRMASVVDRLPKDWWTDVLGSPFSYASLLKMYARINLLTPAEGFRWTKTLDEAMRDRAAILDGLSVEALIPLSDKALVDYFKGHVITEGKDYDIIYSGLAIIFRDVVTMLAALLDRWYERDNPDVVTDLLTGCRYGSTTARENHDLWRLAVLIRNSPELKEKFGQHRGREFFDAAAGCADGEQFLAKYREFVARHGHRGHADRDIYFIRRAEDPAVDYRAFQALLGSDITDPKGREDELYARREALAEGVVQKLRAKPLGGLKAELFKVLYDYAHKCLAARDNERHYFDRSTYAIKRAALEVNRRCRARGRFETDRDFYFLTLPELVDVLFDRDNRALTAAKIAGRMRNFDRYHDKEYSPLPYLVDRREVDLDVPDVEDGSNVFRGRGTSRGSVTGRARVIKTLSEIGNVEAGDIMICNSTDPGWTPVFSVIKGLVLETGGVLAHGSLLSREYGLPAVQLSGALRLVPDGATITVSGDDGTVVIEEEEQVA